MLTQTEIKEIWDYIPDTDSFIWKLGSKFRKVGTPVPTKRRVFLLGHEYVYDRLKSLYLSGDYGTSTKIDPSEILTWETLTNVLEYDENTGIFTWRENRGYKAKIGTQAGSLEQTGYISIRLGRVSYLAHRLAWFYVYKCWPTNYIDHIDRNKVNNAISNLRDIEQVWNSRNRDINKNNTSGYTGVYFSSKDNTWKAEIIINTIKTRLGSFSTPEEASEVYRAFEKAHTHENITIG